MTRESRPSKLRDATRTFRRFDGVREKKTANTPITPTIYTEKVLYQPDSVRVATNAPNDHRGNDPSTNVEPKLTRSSPRNTIYTSTTVPSKKKRERHDHFHPSRSVRIRLRRLQLARFLRRTSRTHRAERLLRVPARTLHLPEVYKVRGAGRPLNPPIFLCSSVFSNDLDVTST